MGESSEVVTERDVEDARMPLPADSKTIPCVVANPAESMLDLPPEGLHRRFAPSHSLARILEHEGLTWGLLLNAFGLRLVRFVESAWLRIAPGNNRRVSAVGADCLVAIP